MCLTMANVKSIIKNLFERKCTAAQFAFNILIINMMLY